MTDEIKEEKKEEQPEPKAEARVEEKAPESFRFILGEKVGMSQHFAEDGECRSVTIVKAGPCAVMRVKSADGADGYNSVLLAYGARKVKNVNKPDAGQFKKAGIAPARFLREIRVPDSQAFKTGQTVDLAGRFSVGDYVDVQGTSKGKGFAGVMKRHKFAGLTASHGASDKERSPGSIASRRSLGRVLPGQRMAGHMGNRTVMVTKIAVVLVDAEKNLLYLNGSVPGPKGSLIMVRETNKQLKKVPAKTKQTKKQTGFAGKVEKSSAKK
ncbi:MAG: 50S ribosomal protein L3 [Elusimicrobiota bacterium]